MKLEKLIFIIIFLCGITGLSFAQNPSGAYTTPSSGGGSVLLNPSGQQIITQSVGNLTIQAASGTGINVLANNGDNIFSAIQNGTAYRVTIGGGAFPTHLAIGSANNDTGGILTCAANVATKNFAGNYVSTPIIILSDETTKGGVNISAKSNTSFSISCTGATDVVDYLVIGNPN